jgi:hypothetical protein
MEVETDSMHNIDNPGPMPEAPSARRLLRSTLIAAAVAIALLVMVVLPAEYGVDPTGVGRALGLREMGEIKMQIAREEAGHTADEVASATPTAEASAAAPAIPPTDAPAAAASSIQPQAPSAAPAKSDVTEIVLRPNEGKEIKLVMRKDARVNYSWATNQGVVNYDTHADAPGIKYHGYGKGTGKPSDEGVLVAAFDGAHGWFWRNRSSDTVMVTLRITGDYQELKRMP